MQHAENVETESTDALAVEPPVREESADLKERAPRRNESTPQPYSALSD
jgi:hypothetical protein